MANKFLSKIKLGDILYTFKDAEAQEQLAKLTPTTVQTTLAAASWNSNIYSFGSTYPKDSYNLIVELDGALCTAEQREVWDAAAIQGSSTTNDLKAFGIVPTVDLPIVITYTQK